MSGKKNQTKLNNVQVQLKQELNTLFYEKADGYLYSKPVTNLEETLSTTSRIYCPVETDTEFWHLDTDINNPKTDITRTIAIQHRAISIKTGLIFTHPDSADIARHPVFKSGFSPLDYLHQLGFNVALERMRYQEDDLPILQFDIYGFFLVAELYRIVTGEYKKDINALVLGRRDDAASINMGRRLIASTILKGNRAEQNVLMPWKVFLGNHPFQVAISFFDCCAVHGAANYKTFCANTEVDLLYKDNFNTNEKGKMRLMYLQRPKDFDDYALGDLYCYPALEGNMSKFRTIYESLGIGDFFEPPRLTIGATVARIVRSSMLNHLGMKIEDKNKVIELCRYGTCDHVKTMKTTGVYNAKVDGGRCRNNRPTDVSIRRPIADVDISGCYGNGLKHQDYPFGRPLIIDYPIKSEQNEYYTLRKFLKKFGTELVPGLWQARVSTPKGYELKYGQDFLMSWYPPKDVTKMPTDTDLQEIDWFNEDNIGLVKIFSHDVHLALINQEFIDWLENTASIRQRAELLDNLLVITAMFYPASEECKSKDEFFNALETHRGKNLCDSKIKRRGTKKISIEQECHAWMRVNLGDLLVTKLLEERSKYDKKKPDEKAMNELYKLCINTIYGDMVSPFFDVGNVVVGNNITARARAMAWYMEKGLNGFQTITDGCAFELNRVIYPGETRLTSETVFITYGEDFKRNYKTKPICNLERIEIDDDSNELGLIAFENGRMFKMTNAHSKDWLARRVAIHLKEVFPNIPVIDKFNFEIKDIYDGGSFHGTANYKFKKSYLTELGKMRSYSKKHEYCAYTLTGDELQLITGEYKPSEVFLMSLLDNPEHVDRSHPYIATKILKPGEYKKNYESRWKNSEAFPGCTVEMGRLLRECSLTQFTFRTYKQFMSWEQESKRLRDKTGQTYESWFLNDDDTLNFQAMVYQLDKLIRGGEMRFSSTRKSSKQCNLAREYEEHPGYPALMKAKHQLGIKYGFVSPDEMGDCDSIINIYDPSIDTIEE